ncbi:transmembrane protein 192-like [Lineus longissimus]|uniref:transmembrane protein 192-like n=1 Tax=Lineus longissimus TaxID=88925 RepID=UPI002B4C4C69
MVSLAPESSSRRMSTGGHFFNADSINNSSEEMFSEYTTLNTEVEPQIRSINTPWAIVLQLGVILMMEIAVFVVPVICHLSSSSACIIDDFSILIYVHAGVWIISLAIDRYVRRQHYFSRRNGYLEFYRITRHIRRSAFVVLSGGNVVLTVLMAAIQDACKGKSPCEAIGIERCHYLQILISLETAIILPLYAIYLVRTCKFNRMRAAPDACQDEIMTSFLVTQSHTSEVGFRDEDYLDEVLEKQGDMIRYLRQHNANLGKKILKLTAEVNNRPR